ncbi:MAG: hypothetical protein KA175_01415 [Flavobacteriales bacterium]|nr:hypothetical protein [Flavobacteriales bacterium]MBP6696244.1 hypothetical protein [Flavobacteriales bacterium]
MHRLLFLALVLFGLVPQGVGQQLYMEVGKSRSAFNFWNSQDQGLEGLESTMRDYAGLGYRRHFHKKVFRLHYVLGATYNRYGARGTSLDEYKYYYDWDAIFIGTHFGVEYEFFTIRDKSKANRGLTFYARVALAPEFFVKGTQTINTQVYDLMGAEQFDSPYFFTRFGGGVNYCVSNTVAIMAQYMYGRGVRLFAAKPDDNETLHIITHHLGFGVFINLPHCRYCFPQPKRKKASGSRGTMKQ